MDGVVANVLVKLDLNETREPSRCILVSSTVRLYKVLRHYFLGKEGDCLREELDFM